MTLNALTKQKNNLIGGSADLAGSNNTKTKNHKIIKPGDFTGDYICLLYTSPSPRDQRGSRMPSSA